MFCVQNQGWSEVLWWPTLRNISNSLYICFSNSFLIDVHSEPFISNSIFMVYRIRCMTRDLVPVVKDMNIGNKANLVSVGLQCWQKNDFLRNYCISEPPCILQFFVPFFSVSNIGKRLCQVSICLTFTMTLRALIIPQLWWCSLNPWNEVWACLCHFVWCPAWRQKLRSLQGSPSIDNRISVSSGLENFVSVLEKN